MNKKLYDTEWFCLNYISQLIKEDQQKSRRNILKEIIKIKVHSRRNC